MSTSTNNMQCWTNFALAMQSFCLHKEASKRDGDKEVLRELLGDDFVWCGSHGMLIFANKCVQIQRNYEILLEQSKALSELYTAEQSTSEKIRDQLRNYTSRHGHEHGMDDDGLGSLTGSLTMDGNDWFPSNTGSRIGINRNNSNNISTIQNIGSHRRLLRELDALEATKDLLAQSHKQLSTQKDYIVGLESLVLSSSRKIEYLTLLCENLKEAKNLSYSLRRSIGMSDAVEDLSHSSKLNQKVTRSVDENENRINGSLPES